jgi:phosphoglycerate dehydrogenase-like enzyme
VAGGGDRVVVLLPSNARPHLVDVTRRASRRVELAYVGNDEPLPDAVAEAQVLYRPTSFRPPLVQSILQSAPALRWVHVPAAGVDLSLIPPLAERGILLTHSEGTYDVAVGEFAMGLVVAAAKGLPSLVRGQDEGRWLKGGPWEDLEHHPVVPATLAGKTIGIIGLGGIGRVCARAARGFGMRVLAVRRSGQSSALAERVYAPDGLIAMLEQCDYVVIAAPLTEATRGMIGERELAAMKPSAWLINIARGQIIDEPALVRALEAGQIAGAGLDVFATEPLPPDYPFWKMPNVIVAPHVSGLHWEMREVEADHFGAELRRFLRGQPLKSLVDFDLGY